MLNFIDFNGVKTPVAFGNAAFYDYEKQTGKNALSDFFNSARFEENGDVILESIKMGFYVDIAFSAFTAGGNIARKPFTGTVYDVAEWLTSDRMVEVIGLLTESLPQPDKSATEGDVTEKPGETLPKTAKGGKG